MNRSPAGALNDIVRFGLELAALISVCAWGWQAGSNVGVRILLAVAAPLAVAIVWGRFVAPRAPHYLRPVGRMAVEFVVFAAATLALVAIDHIALAVAFAIVAAVNTTLIHVLRQDERARAAAVGSPASYPRWSRSGGSIATTPGTKPDQEDAVRS